MRSLLLAGFIVLHVFSGYAQDSRSNRPRAFVGVTVLPMTTDAVLRDHTVLVREGRIEAIGPASTIKLPRKTMVIEAEGMYLIPGLSDLHAHFFGGKKAAPDLLSLYLANGVTSVLNMRGTRGVLQFRESVNSGEWDGPTIYTASPILGNTSPSPKTYERGSELVEEFVQQGYDFIKVYNYIPEEGYNGIIAAAKRLDIPVVGHAVRSVGIEGAMANAQHIAHMEEFIYGYFQDGLDESKILPLARRLKESGIGVIATLCTYHNIIRQVEDIDAMLASPGIEYLPKRMTSRWSPDTNRYLADFTMDTVEKRLKPEFAFQQKLLKAFSDAGVPVLTGTDASVPINVHGYSVHQELQEFVDAGLTPFQAIAASTRDAAVFLRQGDEAGTIETGKRADLVLLRANPLENIANSREIEGVMVRGKWFNQDALTDMLDSILAAQQDAG